jgi:hypothetical protein
MWKSSCKCSDWKYARCSCIEFQWIVSWWKECSHSRLRALQRAKLSQLGNWSCHIIISNVWSIQSYLINGILSIQKNWSDVNEIFIQVQDCLKLYSCSSYDAISLFNVRLTFCRPIVGSSGGALPCRSLLKAKAMTFVSLVIARSPIEFGWFLCLKI